MELEQDVLELLDRVVRSERGELARLAQREGAHGEDALDCVHDAFTTFLQLALQKKLPVDPSEHAPLLAGIVRNAARNKRRRHHVARPHDSLDTVEPSADGPSTEALVAQAEEHIRLRACVASLCDTQRAVVTMRLLEERDGGDVASTLGLSRGHVDVLLHRAKVSLLACMTH